jgi:RNA polymerase sigma-70 factor, ECF subfamily
MEVPPGANPTRLLHESVQGDQRSTKALAALAYEELRQQARRMLGPSPGSIEATVLVHETYLRLIGQEQQDWRSRSHFAAISSTMLRRVLVDALRARGRQRDHLTRLSAVDDPESLPLDLDAVVDLDQALTEFAAVDAQAAHIVELRFFGGLTVREIADELGMPRATVQDAWTFARAWLGRRLEQSK